MAAMVAKVLPKAGDRIGRVCGPGQFPEDDAGVVLSVVSDKWGDYAMVLLDSGQVVSCHGLNSGPGIGWHKVEG